MGEKEDVIWMKQAIAEAERALEEDEIPIGAVIVCGGKIIAKAHNLTETLNDATAHAEMMVFTSASEYLGEKYLKGCTLYVTLQPCPMCAGAACLTRIDRIVYGATDQKHADVDRSVLYHHRTKIQKGILEEECKGILQEFFKKKRM